MRITEGMDRAGNDFMDMSVHGKGKRARRYMSRHFTLEELLYGPGDQSRIWDRERPQRLEPRSASGGRRANRRGYSESYEEYGYSDSCGY